MAARYLVDFAAGKWKNVDAYHKAHGLITQRQMWVWYKTTLGASGTTMSDLMHDAWKRGLATVGG